MGEATSAAFAGPDVIVRNERDGPRDIRPPVVVVGGAKVTKAICGVMGRVKELEKTGYNKEGKYDYASSNDVLAVTQDAMHAEGLVLTPREVDRRIVSKILFIKYEFDAKCEDETVVNLGSHTGSCRFEFKSGTTDDKAANKCMVTANKTYTLTLFRIPTGDITVERADDGDPDGQPIHDDRAPDDRRESRREDDRGQGGRGGNGSSNGWDGDDRGRRRDDRPRDDRPRDDRNGGYGEPAGRREDAPRQESRGRGFDDENPPVGRWDDGENNRQPVDPDEADFRGKIMALKEGIERAASEDDAHDMWRANADLVRRATSSVRAHLEATYEQVHRIRPPNV